MAALLARALTPLREQPPGARRLLGQMTLWWLATTLAGTFVHAFLYRSTHDPLVSVRYALAGFVTYTLLVSLMGAVLKRVDCAKMWRWGTAAQGAVFLIFLLAGERAGQFPVLLGIINGLGMLTFWPAYGLLTYQVTEPGTRSGYQAVHGMVLSIAGMVVPPVAGLLIEQVGAAWGYRMLFSGALLLYAGAIWTGLGHRPAPGHGEAYRLGDALRRSLAVPRWRSVLMFQLLFGIREGLMLFLPGLLVFVATGSEGALGGYSMAMSLLSTVAHYAAGWFYRGRVKPLPLLVGTVALAVSPLLLWVGAGILPLLLFSVATTAATPFLNLAWWTLVPAWIDADHVVRESLQEYQSLREVSTVGGRCLAITAYLLLAPSTPSLRDVSNVLLITSAAVVPGVIIMLLTEFRRGGDQP